MFFTQILTDDSYEVMKTFEAIEEENFTVVLTGFSFSLGNFGWNTGILKLRFTDIIFLGGINIYLSDEKSG